MEELLNAETVGPLSIPVLRKVPFSDAASEATEDPVISERVEGLLIRVNGEEFLVVSASEG